MLTAAEAALLSFAGRLVIVAAWEGARWRGHIIRGGYLVFVHKGGAAVSNAGFGGIISVLDAPLVVVTAAEAQERAGCLVGFHCQSSIEPLRYCVWLSKANHTYRVALGSTHLAIHFLTSADLGLAERFGTLTGDRTDKFAGLPIRPGPGQVPVLEQCSHWLAARRETLLDEGGDHVCMITEPVTVHAGEPFEPLRLSQAAHLEPGHGSQERHSPPTERAARPQPPGTIA